MLRQIASTIAARHVPNKRYISSQKISKRISIGIDLLRNRQDKDEETSLYPALERFGIETRERTHHLSVSCEHVINLIRLGAIPKMIALQYCHFLCQLARDNESDTEYYAERSLGLLQSLLKSDDLPVDKKNRMRCDVADISSKNCLEVVDKIISGGPQVADTLKIVDIQRILVSCYKYNLWDQALSLLHKYENLQVLSPRLCDPLASGVVASAALYKQQSDENGRESIVRHLYYFLARCRQERTQFVISNKKEFIQALQDLNIKVVSNTTIKNSGRCTCCDTHIPLFDGRTVATLNAAILRQILKGAEMGLYLNVSPNDSTRFDDFLKNVYAKDKKPIDCVIDGLNIAYKNAFGFSIVKKQLAEDMEKTVRYHDPEHQAKVLINTIIRGDMLKLFKKMLVVGKWHMAKWPNLLDFFKKQNIYFYSSYNRSKDDLFQLYASTLNHKTILITNDFLRDHLAAMEPVDRTLLERWIDTHQAWICHKTLKPIWPTPYEKIPFVDLSRAKMHIPIIDFNQLDNVPLDYHPANLQSSSRPAQVDEIDNSNSEAKARVVRTILNE